jgi:RNA polymerase sigma factor (sigma-70 family)
MPPRSPNYPPLATTSGHLLARARLGDTNALGRLLHRYLPRLQRIAHGRLPRWVRTAADTADIVHDAIARTLARFGSLDLPEPAAFAAYLTESVRNRIRDEHRRFARRGMAADATVIDSAPSPLDQQIARDVESRYLTALARLAPLDQYLFVGHVELDYNHDQLGHMTGRTRNAARMALQRAMARLAKEMQQA